jgi:Arc/MetJ family transcription regulator
MATNLQINQQLLIKAQKMGGHRTKRETVDTALAEYIRKREQMKIMDLAGTIDYDPAYDYKAERRRSTVKGLRKNQPLRQDRR